MVVNSKPGFYYGYIVVGVGFAVSALMWGTYRTFGLFFEPLSSELNWTSAELSGAFSVSVLLYGVSSIFAGRLSDRFGPRVVLIACALLLGLGYFLMSQVSLIWQLYLVLGVIVGLGMGSVDTPMLSTVARWFVRKRGTATAVIKTGAGMGMLIIPPLAVWLISGYGWRNGYIAMGIISLVGVIAVALFLRRDGEQNRQVSHDNAAKPKIAAGIVTHQFSLREAIGTRQLWIFSVVWFQLTFTVQVVMVHIAPHVVELGISSAIAATVISIIGGASTLGRLAIGGLIDRLGNKAAFIVAIILLVISMALIRFVVEVWVFFIFAALYGIAHGAIFTVISPMLAKLFGLRSLGAILGFVVFVGTIGGAVGPVLSGIIYDATGSYQSAFLLCLVLCILALIGVLFLRPTNGVDWNKATV